MGVPAADGSARTPQRFPSPRLESSSPFQHRAHSTQRSLLQELRRCACNRLKACSLKRGSMSRNQFKRQSAFKCRNLPNLRLAEEHRTLPSGKRMPPRRDRHVGPSGRHHPAPGGARARGLRTGSPRSARGSQRPPSPSAGRGACSRAAHRLPHAGSLPLTRCLTRICLNLSLERQQRSKGPPCLWELNNHARR